MKWLFARVCCRAAPNREGGAAARCSTPRYASSPPIKRPARSRGPFDLPTGLAYNPANNASFDGVAAILLMSHSIADCGGIWLKPRRSV